MLMRKELYRQAPASAIRKKRVRQNWKAADLAVGPILSAAITLMSLV